jgi:hypothetical protein
MWFADVCRVWEKFRHFNQVNLFTDHNNYPLCGEKKIAENGIQTNRRWIIAAFTSAASFFLAPDVGLGALKMRTCFVTGERSRGHFQGFGEVSLCQWQLAVGPKSF